MVLGSGLPAKACSLHFLMEESSTLRVILLSIFFSEKSLLSFLAEVKWHQGQLGHNEVITLVTNFLSLWRVLMLELSQQAGGLLKAPHKKGRNGNIQVEFAGLSPKTGNE